jgi:acyl carrier protein
MPSCEEKLCAILVRDYKLDPTRLTMDATLEDLGLDSLGVAELLFNVEDEFHIELPPESVSLPNLGDVVRFIDALVLAQHPDAAPLGPVAAMPA